MDRIEIIEAISKSIETAFDEDAMEKQKEVLEKELSKFDSDNQILDISGKLAVMKVKYNYLKIQHNTLLKLLETPKTK
jgi:hypothetical protein